MAAPARATGKLLPACPGLKPLNALPRRHYTLEQRNGRLRQAVSLGVSRKPGSEEGACAAKEASGGEAGADPAPPCGAEGAHDGHRQA